MLGSPAGGRHWLGGPASHLWPSIQAGLPGHRAGERGSAGAMWTVIGGMWTLPDVFQYIGICVHESRDNMRFLLSLLFFLNMLCSSIMPHSAARGSHSSASSPCHFLRSSLLVFLWLMVYHSVDMLRFILLFYLGKNLSCFRLKNVVFTQGTLLPSWQQLGSCCLRYVIGFHGDLLRGSKFLWVT